MNWAAEPIDNFTLREARCHGYEKKPSGRIWHDCGLVILVPELCIATYNVRIEFGKPIVVKSWTRCRLHNQAVGGKSDSYHQNGHAIDPAPQNISDLDELEQIARKYFGFVIRYSWGLHCDIRGERP